MGLRSLVIVLALFIGACGHDHGGHDHSDMKVEATPYIVELFDDVDVDAFVDEHYLEPTARLPIIHGFSAELRPATVEALEADLRVERLTADKKMNALADEHSH